MNTRVRGAAAILLAPYILLTLAGSVRDYQHGGDRIGAGLLDSARYFLMGGSLFLVLVYRFFSGLPKLPRRPPFALLAILVIAIAVFFLEERSRDLTGLLLTLLPVAVLMSLIALSSGPKRIFGR